MNKLNNKNDLLTYGCIAFIAIGLSIMLLFPLSESKTIILQTPSGTDSCVVDFVLAQNLTDLCDVTIISPSTGELIQYNGSQWINVSNATLTESTVCNNLGTGAIICAGGNVNIRTLIGSPDISVVQNANDITIDYNGTLVSDNTVCTNLGTVGEGIYVSGECNFKKLLAGSGITLSANGTRITITNSLPEVTACNNVGTGNQLCSGGNVNIDTLIAGTGITISDTTDDWTFASQCANTGTGEAICESSNNINSLIGSSGITITDTTGDLTISPKWELLCQNTLAGPSTSLSCGAFAQRNNLYAIIETRNDANATNSGSNGIRFNSDSGTNYAWRSSLNGAVDITAITATRCQPSVTSQLVDSTRMFVIHINNNEAGDRKTAYYTLQSEGAGSGTVPDRGESICVWGNTASKITTITLDWAIALGTPQYKTNTMITVWGYD